MTAAHSTRTPSPSALAAARPPSPLPSPAGAWCFSRGRAAVGYKGRRLLHAQPFAACPSGPVSRVGAEGGGWGDGVGKQPLTPGALSFPGWPGRGLQPGWGSDTLAPPLP